jgi:hypothetical protein
MAVDWGIQKFEPRVQLDLSPLTSQLNFNRQEKRQQSLADLTLSQEEKKARKELKRDEIMANATGPNGEMNRQYIASEFGRNGLNDELNEITSIWDKQDSQKREQQKFEFEKQKAEFDFAKEKEDKTISDLSNFSTSIFKSKNPLNAFMVARKDAVKNKLPISQNLLNYFPTDEEIADGRLDPRVKEELDFYMNKAAKKTGPMTLEEKLEEMEARYAEKEKLIASNLLAKKELADYQSDVKVNQPLTEAEKLRERIAKENLNTKTPEFQGAVAAAKQKATGEERPIDVKERSKAAITKTVGELRNLYNELDALGGIVNVEKGSLNNLGARISSSSLGQEAQKALGTKAQSLRNSIIASQPELLGAIRKASDMGAKGMDSEKELQFYLRAATDPKEDIQFNLRALKKLDEAYGLGFGLADAPKKTTEQIIYEQNNITDTDMDGF